MASVIFGSTLDMLTAATPSSGGKVVAYDLDGILKQKDEFGVIIEIGGGPTAGAGGTPSLSDVMGISNIANVPLIMGTSTSILSSNGGGRIDLDYSGSTNSILISTDNASQGEHGILMDDSNYSLFANGYSQALVLHDGTDNIELYNTLGDLKLGVGLLSRDDLKISNNGSSTSSTSNNNKQAVFVGTRNSMMSPGVFNSVIIGGQSITGTQSNYVYIGGSLNINDSYTLPNIDGSSGQLLTSDGLGNIYWSSDVNTSGLSDVLLIDNNSGTHNIIMGTSTNILSSNGSSEIHLDYNGSPNSIYISPDPFLPTNISLDTDISINANDVLNISANTASVFTGNSQGFVYGTDYSGTFVNNSLVSKLYVDNGTASLWTAIDNINNDYITEVIGGVGLTGGGTAGVVTLDAQVNNGLSIISDNIGLGGTLSQNTSINSDGYDITLGDIGYLLFTSSVFDVESDFVSLDSGTGSTQILSGGDTTLSSTNLDLLASDGVYVVGSSFSVNSVEIDPTSATNGQALLFDGVKFSPSTLSGTYLPLAGGTMSGPINMDNIINMSDGQYIQFLQNGFQSRFNADPSINSNQVWTLPNATGTIALDTDITNFANTNLTFTGNRQHLTEGSSFSLRTAVGGGTGNSWFNINTSYSEYLFNTTSIYIADNELQLRANGINQLEVGDWGVQINDTLFLNDNIDLTGLGNKILFSNGFDGSLEKATLTAPQTWTLPDYTGTIALTSDITANKVSDIRNFTASVAETITHTLNTEDLIIQTYDSTGLQIIPDSVQINGTASIDVTISQTLSNIKTIIIG